MAILLEIRKKSTKNFWHNYIDFEMERSASDWFVSFSNNQVFFSDSSRAFLFKKDGFDVSEIVVYDETGTGSAEVFATGILLAQRLVELGYNAYYTDGDVDLSAYQLKPLITADTGTEINLSRSGGNLCNMASANSTTTYTTTGEVDGGNAIILINASSEPTITGGTKIKGSDFIVSTDMHLIVQYFGVTVQYFFLEL